MCADQDGAGDQVAQDALNELSPSCSSGGDDEGLDVGNVVFSGGDACEPPIKRPRKSFAKIEAKPVPANLIGAREEDAEKESQKVKEKEFFDYFGNLVSEWNPCFSADGGSALHMGRGDGFSRCLRDDAGTCTFAAFVGRSFYTSVGWASVGVGTLAASRGGFGEIERSTHSSRCESSYIGQTSVCSRQGGLPSLSVWVSSRPIGPLQRAAFPTSEWCSRGILAGAISAQ